MLHIQLHIHAAYTYNQIWTSTFCSAQFVHKKFYLYLFFYFNKSARILIVFKPKLLISTTDNMQNFHLHARNRCLILCKNFEQLKEFALEILDFSILEDLKF